MYGLHAALEWTLTYDTLIAIPGAGAVVPADVLDLMQEDPELYVLSNWLVSDGFEKITDNVPRVHRVARRQRRTEMSPGIIGRVNLNFTTGTIPRPELVISFELWPSGKKLKEWYSSAVAKLIRKYNNVQCAAADEALHKLDVPLAGGAALASLDQVALQASSEERVIAYRYTDGPAPKYLRIINVTSTPMKAVRCFTEEQLGSVATDETTLAELAKPSSTRARLLNTHTLYPAINGCYTLAVHAHQLREKVYIVSSAVAVEAARIQSSHSFFVADHAIGQRGSLLPLHAMPREDTERITRQIFVPNHMALVPIAQAALQVHWPSEPPTTRAFAQNTSVTQEPPHEIDMPVVLLIALQDAVIDKVRREKQRADPFTFDIPHFPEPWRHAVLQGMQHVSGSHEYLEKVFSSNDELSAVFGSVLLHTDGGWKRRNVFIKLQISSSEPDEPPAKQRRGTQPMGSVRLHLPTGKLTGRIGAVVFNNASLTAGNVPGRPSTLPTDGGTGWVFNVATFQYQSNRMPRPTTSEILRAHPQLAEDALFPM